MGEREREKSERQKERLSEDVIEVPGPETDRQRERKKENNRWRDTWMV